MKPANWLTAQRAATTAVIANADSPAEAALLVHLLTARDGDGYLVGRTHCVWQIATQVVVRVERGTYRLDAALTRGKHRVCVEVDGHEFHHATEEQEERDWNRDRALRSAGWEIIRVDAWKVFKDPSDCVDMIASRLHDIESTGERKPYVSVEDQTEEEFAETVAKFEAAMRAYPEAANENAERVRQMRSRRKSIMDLRAFLELQKNGVGAAENENRLLRELFEGRRTELRSA